MVPTISKLEKRKLLVQSIISIRLFIGLFGSKDLTSPDGFSSTLDECYSDVHMLLYEAKDPNRKRKIVQVYFLTP